MILGKCLRCSCLIYLSTSLYNSIMLVYIGGLMISTQCHYLLASTWWKHSSTVAYISRIADFANNEYYNSTGSWPLNDSHLTSYFILCLTHLKESWLSLCKTTLDSLFWIPRERVFLNHIMMKIISEKLGTRTSTVTIVNTEERASWPCFVLSMFRLHNVEDYRNSVFVIVTH